MVHAAILCIDVLTSLCVQQAETAFRCSVVACGWSHCDECCSILNVLNDCNVAATCWLDSTTGLAYHLETSPKVTYKAPSIVVGISLINSCDKFAINLPRHLCTNAGVCHVREVVSVNLCIVPLCGLSLSNRLEWERLGDSEFNGNSLVAAYCTFGFCSAGYTIRCRECIVGVCLTGNCNYLLCCNNITFVLELVCYGCNVWKHRESLCRVKVAGLDECNGITCVNCAPVVNNHLLATAKVDVFVGVAFEVYTYTAFANWRCIGKFNGLTSAGNEWLVRFYELLCTHAVKVVVLAIVAQYCKLLVCISRIRCCT